MSITSLTISQSKVFRVKDLEEQNEFVNALLQNEDISQIKTKLGEILMNELGEASPNYTLIEKICQIREVLFQQRSDQSLPIHVACFNECCLNSIEIVALLVEKAPETLQHKNQLGLVPLHQAVSICNNHNLDTVKMLIDHWLPALTAKTNDGHTPLHLALVRPKTICIDLIRHMIEINGKIVSIPDAFGHLPIHKAVSRSRVDIDVIELLLATHPASAAIQDFRGFLPLHWVTSKKEPNLEVLFLLAEKHPEGLLQYDHDGCTPYMKYLQNQFREREVEEALIDLTNLARELVLEKSRNSLLITGRSSTTASSPSSRSTYRRRSHKGARR